jgi:hypothetical protein
MTIFVQMLVVFGNYLLIFIFLLKKSQLFCKIITKQLSLLFSYKKFTSHQSLIIIIQIKH